MIAAPIFALLLSLHPCYAEPPDPARLELIANAIAAVSSTVDDAAGLIAIGTFESSWCKSVHSGAKRGGHGIGLWQLEPGSRRLPPFAGLSLEDTTHAAGEALWLWRRSYACGSTPVARFSSYAGLPCQLAWLGAGKRARLFRFASWKLTAALHAIDDEA